MTERIQFKRTKGIPQTIEVNATEIENEIENENENSTENFSKVFLANGDGVMTTSWLDPPSANGEQVTDRSVPSSEGESRRSTVDPWRDVSAGQSASVPLEGVVSVALFRELKRLPDEVRFSPLAALAMSLASNIDKGEKVPECSRELRQCLSQLNLMNAGDIPGSNVDELKKKRQERRSS